MKTLNFTLDDQDYDRLKNIKNKLSWKDLLLELPKYIEWRQKWINYFNEFMINHLDSDVTNPAQMRDLVDELSIQLEAFIGLI